MIALAILLGALTVANAIRPAPPPVERDAPLFFPW